MRRVIALLFCCLLLIPAYACRKDATATTETTEAETETVTANDAAEDTEDTDTNINDGGEESMQKNPIATITMENGGIIKVELYPDKAENTVRNFISLANSGYYDGLIFHRVIAGFMIQGGDPKGTGTGGPGYSIKGEFSGNGYKKNDLSHVRGVISMARSSMPNSAGSQFFIMHADAAYLDGNYAAFGKVIEGIEVVDEIASVSTNYQDRPMVEQKMASIRVDTFGVEYAEPDKIQ